MPEAKPVICKTARQRSGSSYGSEGSPFRLLVAFELWRRFGSGWLLNRLLYLLKRRTGYLAWHLPIGRCSDIELSLWLRKGISANPSFFARQRLDGRRFFKRPARSECERVMAPKLLLDEVEAALAGRWRYFEKTWHEIGFPPDWNFNPITRRSMAADRHWSRIGDFGYEDIKLIWEPSRFAIAYKLVRAYALTESEKYPEAFWQLVEDWAEKNPPQQGPNWSCGQEAAFRIMAWCFALFGFRGSPHSTPEREAFLAALIAVHAARIEANISYALSQKNNHAISEAVGLWTTGLLFPEFEDSPRWLGKGRRILEREACRQIYPDGGYIQHSANYHRLMLQNYLWAIRLGELNGEPLSEGLRQRVGLAAEFLQGIQDPESGTAPNYGANDGALILGLNSCDFADYRPVLNSLHYLLHGQRLYPAGPWEEDLLWMFGSEALLRPVAKQKRRSLSAPHGGCYTLIGDKSWALIRCARYRDRPSQADQLHFDLWWRGINLACDAGTYLYTGPPPWDQGLAQTAVHNTLGVDGQDQMLRAGRFLWLKWAQGKARIRLQSNDGRLEYWEGQHDGYRRLRVPALHTRAVVRLGAEHWVVLDRADSQKVHRYQIQWLFPDLPCQWEEGAKRCCLQTRSGQYWIQAGSLSGCCRASLLRADTRSCRGWRSCYYSHREPALSMSLAEAGVRTLFLTVFGPGDWELNTQKGFLDIVHPDWKAIIQLARQDSLHSLISQVRLEDGIQSDLGIDPSSGYRFLPTK